MPQFEAQRTDTKELRGKILKMSYKEWKEMGYSKGSLWYIKKNSENIQFKVYKKSLNKF
jgi:CRISPR-associated protein Cas1